MRNQVYTKSLINQNKMKQTAVEWLEDQYIKHSGNLLEMRKSFEQAKKMDKEQKGYSEEEVRLAYFQGEKDSYVKGGQTKEMEDEFIQSLKQKHETFKSE